LTFFSFHVLRDGFSQRKMSAGFRAWSGVLYLARKMWWRWRRSWTPAEAGVDTWVASISSQGSAVLVHGFCTDDHSDAYLSLEGYELVGRKDGKTTTWGIARGLLLCCKRGIQARVVEVEGGEVVTEMLVVGVTWGQEELNLCLVYRAGQPERQGQHHQDGGCTEEVGGTNSPVWRYEYPKG
jgi:hypothetical protein